MNDYERYQFDLNGYFLVKGALDKDSAAHCLTAVDAMEHRIASTVDDEPHFIGHFGLRYHHDRELGCSSYLSNHGGGGLQYVVDDFLNADPAFDVLVGHEPVTSYIREMVVGSVMINSSELRYRHRGNITGTHMGGPIDARNRYRYFGRAARRASGDGRNSAVDFDLLNVRVIYALHDVPAENGPLCVVPGSHKANFHSPYGADPMKEPGMIPVPMETGDALFFTENLRHGGYPNTMERTRKTLHLCFGPSWVGSQSPAHQDGFVRHRKGLGPLQRSAARLAALSVADAGARRGHGVIQCQPAGYPAPRGRSRAADQAQCRARTPQCPAERRRPRAHRRHGRRLQAGFQPARLRPPLQARNSLRLSRRRLPA